MPLQLFLSFPASVHIFLPFLILLLVFEEFLSAQELCLVLSSWLVPCSEGLDGDGSVQGQVQEEAPVTKELRSHLLEQSSGFPVVITVAKDFCLSSGCMVPTLKNGCFVMKNGSKEILFLELFWPLSGKAHAEASGGGLAAEEPARLQRGVRAAVVLG